MDNIEFLSQPLMTEDGFLNPACLNELEAAIKNMPKTFERLFDDPEWNEEKITYYREIAGYFIHWAVRQQNNQKCLPNLENITNYLMECLRREFAKKDTTHYGEMGWGYFSLCQINKILYDILWDLPSFLDWNDEKIIGKEWLDLDALLHNVCISIRNERRKNEEFDKKFEEDWKENLKNEIYKNWNK